MTGDWRDDALCAETDLDAFFPEQGQPNHRAKKICARCEVAVQCLAYALTNDEHHGIWGGTSEKDRKLIRRERAA